MSSNAMGPKVSILLPVYNAQAFLERCLESILTQTYKNIEIVAIDDGSTDGSAAILDSYAVRYPETLVVEHQANAGAAHARNRALELATGEYLTFIDNDDWLDKDFVETLAQAAMGECADVVCSGYRRPNQKGQVILEAIPKPSDEWAPYLVEAAWAKLYRTDYVRQNGFAFLDTNIDEDLYFSLPAVELAQKLVVVPYCGYNWFYNEESVSNTNQKTSAGLRFEETLEAILAMLRERNIELTGILNHYFIRLITWFLLFTRKGDGGQLSAQNLRHYIGWLDEHIPEWRKDPYAKPGHPTGDAFANQVAVWLFVKHPLTFKVALKVYGRLS